MIVQTTVGSIFLMFLANTLSAGDTNAVAVEKHPLPQLETRLAEIDNEVAGLARYSLCSGIGPISYRSTDHATATNTEWVQIDLGNKATFDEVALVPAIWRDTQAGFRADGYPVGFRVIAGTGTNCTGTVLAAFGAGDKLLPRIAPVIIPCPGTTASWVRVEATVLSPRAFDGRYNLELAEILVFDGQDDIAWRRPVLVSSEGGGKRQARWAGFAVDGFLPYLMHSAQGKPSVAYMSVTPVDQPVSLMIDLGASMPINRILLHAVDVEDTFPQAQTYDFCMPRRVIMEGANRPDFTDAEPLIEYQMLSPRDIGPLIYLQFPESYCRYVRLTIPDIPRKKDDNAGRNHIGFAEIEVFSKGTNVAFHKPVSASFPSTEVERPLSHLTDGANFYGKILPIRGWMEQLARRHDLEQERTVLTKELNRRYARQKVLLQRMAWLAALLVAGLVVTILIDRILRLREVARIKERLAADLHDEIGANLHTIGMLSDLAEDARDTPEEHSMLHGRIRAMTERSGTAVRHFADLLNTNGLYTDLASDIRRASERIMAKVEQDVVIEGEEHLRKLKTRTCFDLFLFYKECLVNIGRHSGATRFSTRLVATDRTLQLTVADNGRGVAEQDGEAIPRSLKRRAKLMGAKLAVERPDGGGTRIVLRLRTRRWGRHR